MSTTTVPSQIFPSALPKDYDEAYKSKHSGRINAEEAIQETAILISDFNNITGEISQQPKPSETQKSEAMKKLEESLIDNLKKLSENKTKLEKRLNEIKWSNRNPMTFVKVDESRNQQKIIIEGLLLQIKDAIKSKIKYIKKNKDGNIQIETNDGFIIICGFVEAFFRLLTLVGGKTRKNKKQYKTKKNITKKSHKKSHKKLHKKLHKKSHKKSSKKYNL